MAGTASTPLYSAEELEREFGLDAAVAADIARRLSAAPATASPEALWAWLCTEVLRPDLSFALHRALYHRVYANWPESRGAPPTWLPDAERVAASNLAGVLRDWGLADYDALWDWACHNRAEFWRRTIDRLGIRFRRPPQSWQGDPQQVRDPRWLAGAQLNIAESCFQADSEATAVLYQPEGGPLQRISYEALRRLVDRVSNGLRIAGFQPGDALAIYMPMTLEAVALYLGIVQAGCLVVSVADSFSSAELATRMRIGKAQGIFTQDRMLRGGRELPLFDKVVAADAPRAIVIPCADELRSELRADDLSWVEFLPDPDRFEALPADPDATTNVLFSSGTTGDPKAIPWSHSTPIKCAADAYFHHDIQAGQVVAWPTNLGWMMGPWLIYAALVNRGTIALYYGLPTGAEFAKFIEEAGVQMLGVVPSLVRAWKHGDCLAGVDWTRIRAFSSTGECSNAEEMHWLMASAGYRPVIEYCGGTEIGGGYVTQTVVQPCAPSTFSTPALGLDFELLDEEHQPTDEGEVFLVPPSIGLSIRLLNRDHDEVYYEGTPSSQQGTELRRHGDRVERLPNGYFRAQGRADDTMNLGGIKISSAELERAAGSLDGVHEVAAIALSPAGGGPSLLTLFVVPEPGAELDPAGLQPAMQKAIASTLNPLFKVHAVQVVDHLPRTASGKIMRRELRAGYSASKN